MSDKIDIVLDELKEFRKEQRGNFIRLNGRIRKLEIWRGYIIGIAAILALGASLLVRYLGR